MAVAAAQRLLERADMLAEYFAIDIRARRETNESEHDAMADEAETIVLLALPQILDGYVPPLLGLPLFLLRLATEVHIRLVFNPPPSTTFSFSPILLYLRGFVRALASLAAG